MSNFNIIDINNLPINPLVISKLKKANLFSSKKILNFSVPELQRCAKLSTFEANIVIQAVSSAELNSSMVDAFSILNNSGHSYLNFEFFSKHFGCIYPGTITEICGESGVGKTQLCLFLTICAILPEYLGKETSNVIYLHSEGEFPIQRFINMSETFKKRNQNYQGIKFSDHLILKKVYNLKETLHVLQNSLPELQKKVIPKVIIIDSVAALLRFEYDSMNTRNIMIQQLAVELWKLVQIHKMVVICVNQVSGSLQKDNATSNIVSTDIPSLGLMWANVLTTRIKLNKREISDESSVQRAFEVIFSSYHPRLLVNFSICGDGIDTLNEHLL